MALRQEEFTSLCDDVDLDRDRALVERCQAGDSAAFGNLYARYYERLLRFCLRRLNDRHEAEDAAQEAFARAWKALPQFAGERRFYPWLTVIAGNICTDMLRRRSRSTPTDDLELTAHQPVGGGGAETSEELVLAAVDGELVNRALGRLSVRHRHVLAMREGSGWTYQQIADHEGVEIGTIETLLWRARQALKREFNVLSESKGAMGGFLAGAGALVRRSVMRVAHKGALLQGSGGSGGLRNALVGVGVTSAAVAAALITPHALATSHATPPAPLAISAGSNLAAPTFPAAQATPVPTTESTPSTDVTPKSSDSDSSSAGTGASTTPVKSTILKGGLPDTGSGSGGTGPLGDTNLNNLPVPSGLTPVISGLGQVTSGLTNDLSGVTNVVNGLATTLGLAQVLSQLGLIPPPAGAASTSTATSTTVPTLLGAVNATVKGLLGSK